MVVIQRNLDGVAAYKKEKGEELIFSMRVLFFQPPVGFVINGGLFSWTERMMGLEF
jgi:hypothetical protein